MIIDKASVHIMFEYEQNLSKYLTYAVYSAIINKEHTFYIGEYKNEKRTKPCGRVGMRSSARVFIGISLSSTHNETNTLFFQIQYFPPQPAEHETFRRSKCVKQKSHKFP